MNDFKINISIVIAITLTIAAAASAGIRDKGADGHGAIWAEKSGEIHVKFKDNVSDEEICNFVQAHGIAEKYAECMDRRKESAPNSGDNTEKAFMKSKYRNRYILSANTDAEPSKQIEILMKESPGADIVEYITPVYLSGNQIYYPNNEIGIVHRELFYGKSFNKMLAKYNLKVTNKYLDDIFFVKTEEKTIDKILDLVEKLRKEKSVKSADINYGVAGAFW